MLVFTEDDYRSMGDTLPYGVWMSDAQGKSLYVSQSFLGLVEMTFEEYQQRGFTHRVHPDDLEADQADWKLCRATGKMRDFERRILGPDGKYHYVLTRGMAVRNSAGEIVKWVGINLDIDERKRIEQENARLLGEIARERERMTNIIDHVPGVVWEVWGRPSMMGLCTNYVSDYVEKLTGYATTEWIKDCRFLAKILYPADIPSVMKKFDEIFYNKKNDKIEFRIINREGKIVWVEAQCNVICNKVGDPVGMRGVAVDITQRKLESEQKDEFLSIASHELKTPVTSIRGFTQILDRGVGQMSETEVRRYLRKVNGYVDRLADLVSDLLDSSKIQAGKLQLKQERFNLVAIIKEVIEDLQTTTAHHTIGLESTGWALVQGDQDRLGQVLFNLISNAIKYSPTANKVLVTTHNEAGQVIVGVRDYGIGIPKSKQGNIFERYYRAHEASSTFAGLGIGLYIARQIVERHGGKMWVESMEGEGSTFYFNLPLIETKI